jgi:hypothetical protein
MVPAFSGEQERFHLVANVDRNRLPNSEDAARETVGGFTAARVTWSRATWDLVSRLEPDAALQGTRRTANVRLDNAPHRSLLKK